MFVNRSGFVCNPNATRLANVAFFCENETMNDLIIDTITIRKDAEGRYCLNDLHKAAGGESRHQPGKWLENQQTQNLVEALMTDTGNPVSGNNKPLNIIKGGSGIQGTFVCEDLVFDYAMWISAEFKLKVIRAYKALTTPQPVPTIAVHYDQLSDHGKAISITKDMMDLGKLFNAPLHIVQQEACKEIKARVNIDLTRLLSYSSDQDHISEEEMMLEPTELGRMFNLSPMGMNKKLEALGLQERIDGKWTPTDFGQTICIKHSWTKGSKSGYNLKWNVSKIKNLLTPI